VTIAECVRGVEATHAIIVGCFVLYGFLTLVEKLFLAARFFWRRR